MASLNVMSYADIALAIVPAAPPTRKNQRATSWPAPISANVPYFSGSRLTCRAFECVLSASVMPRHYGNANTQIPPPLGGSGYLPGNNRFKPPFMPATSPAHPVSTATYCLPSTVKVLGGATIPELVSASHSNFPVAASNAWSLRSLVPPVKTRPPAVASIEPQFGLVAYSCVHTRMPVSTFHACTSPPMCLAPGAVSGRPPNRTPAYDVPALYV